MENICKNCVYAVLGGTCFISNKRIDPSQASCHDFTRRDSTNAEAKTYDPVNSPKHYTSGKVECIDAMIETFGVEAVKHFCLCNAFKYHWRHELKNGDEDIKKATWYMNKYKELENR